MPAFRLVVVTKDQPEHIQDVRDVIIKLTPEQCEQLSLRDDEVVFDVSVDLKG